MADVKEKRNTYKIFIGRHEELWAGFAWIRIETNVDFLEHGNEFFVFHKMVVIS